MKLILLLTLTMLIAPIISQSPGATILTSNTTAGLPDLTIVLVSRGQPRRLYKFQFSCRPNFAEGKNGTGCVEIKAPNNGLLSASFSVETDHDGNLLSISAEVPNPGNTRIAPLILQEEELGSSEGLKAEMPKAARNMVDFIEKRNKDLKGEDVFEHVCKILRAQLQGKDSIE